MSAMAMKKAWEIFKKWGVRTMAKWTEALRLAWAIVKGLVKEEKEVVELKGTPKQVKWAKDIRDRVVPVVERVTEVAKGKIIEMYTEKYGEELAKERTAQLDEVVKSFINEQSAAKWIDRFAYEKDEVNISRKIALCLDDICKEFGYSNRIINMFHKAAVEIYM